MARPKPEREFLTPPEVAAAVGSRPETVIGWIRSGELPAVDFARRGSAKPRFRVRRDDFEQFLARRAVVPKRAPAPRPQRIRPTVEYV